MYREPDRQVVHNLYAKGLSKAAIARTLGMSRNTVAKLARLHEAPVFAGRNTLSKKEELAIELRTRARAHRARCAQESEMSEAELSRNAGQNASTAQNYIDVTLWR